MGKFPILLHFVRSFIYSTHLNFATFVFKRKHAVIMTEYILHVSVCVFSFVLIMVELLTLYKMGSILQPSQ